MRLSGMHLFYSKTQSRYLSEHLNLYFTLTLVFGIGLGPVITGQHCNVSEGAPSTVLVRRGRPASSCPVLSSPCVPQGYVALPCQSLLSHTRLQIGGSDTACTGNLLLCPGLLPSSPHLRTLTFQQRWDKRERAAASFSASLALPLPLLLSSTQTLAAMPLRLRISRPAFDSIQ